LLQMLFQLEERHVQEVHRLVQARVHPELLPLGYAELVLQERPVPSGGADAL
jgi:hypothetical protein